MNFIEQIVKKGDIKIIVEKVHVEGNGVILLTGPSSCGKGEIAKALCKFLSIPEKNYLSMGDILRRTVTKARKEKSFQEKLALDYGISNKVSIFDVDKNRADIINKAEIYKSEILSTLNILTRTVSQLDWLEFCITKGLLVPDDWTVKILDALLDSSDELMKEIFILDGYPRTVTAAENLLKTLNKLNIPVIKVLHLSITKEQMKIRAQSRNRFDDTDESLDRRYQFYIDKVQPCIDYLKFRLGVPSVALIDAHQPVYTVNEQIDIDASIHEVILSVMQALGLPRYLIDIE